MRKIPLSTYRIQFTPTFGFAAAEEIIDYLADLGISDIYASPIFKARPGSEHGYDIVDPTELNPELGSPEEFEQLHFSAKKKALGWLQDIVPNHMAIDSQNRMLMDILENGESSPFFNYFDIDWDFYDESIHRRLLIPVLGKFYSEALENGEIQLRYDQSGLSINYHNLKLPIRLESYVKVFECNIDALEEKLGGTNPEFIRFLGNVEYLRSLPPRKTRSSSDNEVIHQKRMLWLIYEDSPVIREYMDQCIETFNGVKGDPRSFDALDQLLSEQLFRLSFWKVAAEELNYRRFFAINELISVRQENEEVFETTHDLIRRYIDEGIFTSLRVDHIDGLYDPTAYLQKLRQMAGEIFIAVEKILQTGEELPSFWPIQGTTGYDFMNNLNGIFCRREHRKTFDKIYERFTGQRLDFDNLVLMKKRMIIGYYMAGDIDNLARALKELAARERHGADITPYGLRRALVEIMASFPVYRTYINESYFRRKDEFYIKDAINIANRSYPALTYELNFLEKFFLMEKQAGLNESDRQDALKFIMLFQQYTGPLMAKGFEDTVLYIYNRLISLNEVGGAPDLFGTNLEDFHEFNRNRFENFPYSLNATSTHDTKRSEDVRARINVLSEIPQEWESSLKLWHNFNRKLKKNIGGRLIPDDNDEYFLYQTLLGSYPHESELSGYIERIESYMIKAVKEAKVHTAWIKPDSDYETGFLGFIKTIMTPSENNRFLPAFLPLQRRVAFYGMLNSLSQTLLKIAAPGVPAFYQGCELWDLSFVDPDNRRPVDFEKRKAYLRYLKEKIRSDINGLLDELTTKMSDGRIKMFLIYQALRARKEHEILFRDGTYMPLEAGGKFKNNIVAFSRQKDGRIALAIAPRFLTEVTEDARLPLGAGIWEDTYIEIPFEIASAANLITGEKIRPKKKLLAGDLFKRFPVALIVGEIS